MAVKPTNHLANPSAEVLAEEEARKRRLTQTADQLAEAVQRGDGLDIFKALLGFLFDFIFGNDPNAPDESPDSAPPVSMPDRVRAAQEVLRSDVQAKWKKLQAEQGGKPVIHASPVAGNAEVTSGYGMRMHPTLKVLKHHAGLDFGARGGDATPAIKTSADGIVLFSGPKDGYGNAVLIGHADGSTTLYGHLTGRDAPAIGAPVKQGELIGEMGTTGRSTGVHLHYEQRDRNNHAIAPAINGTRLAKGDMLRGDDVQVARGVGKEKPPVAEKPAVAAAKPIEPAKPAALSTQVQAQAKQALSFTPVKPPAAASTGSTGNGKFEVSDITSGAVALATGISTRIGALVRG